MWGNHSWIDHVISGGWTQNGMGRCGVDNDPISCSRSSARNPNRRGWSPLLTQLHGVPPWGDEKKGGGPEGSSSFFPSRGASDETLDSPAINEREEGGEGGSSGHPTQAQGFGIEEGKKAHTEHAPNDCGKRTQYDNEAGVTGRRFGSPDNRPHDEPDEAPHDNPDTDTDPVLHRTPLGGVHCLGTAGNVPGLCQWNQSGLTTGLTTTPSPT